MSHLKEKNVKKCFSLLREYIDETPLNNKKENAILALNQLQQITAGTGSQGSSSDSNSISSICHGRPLADRSG